MGIITLLRLKYVSFQLMFISFNKNVFMVSVKKKELLFVLNV